MGSFSLIPGRGWVDEEDWEWGEEGGPIPYHLNGHINSYKVFYFNFLLIFILFISCLSARMNIS